MEKKEEPTQVIKKAETPLVELVLSRVTELESVGGLTTPPNYSAANALRSAWLMLNDQKDKAGLPVLQTCTKESIMSSLFNMTVQGLSPMKHQCAFIPRGNKLVMQRQYSGSIALARRFGKVDDVKSVVIYKDDVFRYSIDPKTGRKTIIEHTQALENIGEDKVRGAYAIISYLDGTYDMEPMTIDQIRASWSQGMGNLADKGAVHNKFSSAMARKTVINSACKVIIDSSDDSALFADMDEEAERPKFDAKQIANTGNIVDIPEEVQTPEVIEPEPEQQEAQPDTKVKVDKRTREWKQGDAPIAGTDKKLDF